MNKDIITKLKNIKLYLLGLAFLTINLYGSNAGQKIYGLGIEYNYADLKDLNEFLETENMEGVEENRFSFNLSKAWMSKKNLWLDGGIGIEFPSYSKKNSNTNSYKFTSLDWGVNVGYRFLADKKLSIIPSLGVGMRYASLKLQKLSDTDLSTYLNTSPGLDARHYGATAEMALGLLMHKEKSPNKKKNHMKDCYAMLKVGAEYSYNQKWRGANKVELTSSPDLGDFRYFARLDFFGNKDKSKHHKKARHHKSKMDSENMEKDNNENSPLSE